MKTVERQGRQRLILPALYSQPGQETVQAHQSGQEDLLSLAPGAPIHPPQAPVPAPEQHVVFGFSASKHDSSRHTSILSVTAAAHKGTTGPPSYPSNGAPSSSLLPGPPPRWPPPTWLPPAGCPPASCPPASCPVTSLITSGVSLGHWTPPQRRQAHSIPA